MKKSREKERKRCRKLCAKVSWCPMNTFSLLLHCFVHHNFRKISFAITYSNCVIFSQFYVRCVCVLCWMEVCLSDEWKWFSLFLHQFSCNWIFIFHNILCEKSAQITHCIFYFFLLFIIISKLYYRRWWWKRNLVLVKIVLMDGC